MERIKGRFFLVGCPRSGTTLLQSLIVAHGDVTSFPESKFFQRIVVPGTVYYPFNLAPRKSRRIFKQFLADIDREDLGYLLPSYAVFIPQFINSFLAVLDRVTSDRNCSYWLEKTPEHLRRINAIESYMEGAKFVHIVRNGIDTIASLYEMTQKYPQTWGKPRKLDRYIDRWQEDIAITSQHIHKPNHFLVRYEALLQNPEPILQGICDFMGISYSSSMLQQRSLVAGGLMRKRERWKSKVYGSLQPPSSAKFYHLFDKEQQEYILSRIHHQYLDLDNFPLSKQYAFVTDKPCRL